MGPAGALLTKVKHGFNWIAGIYTRSPLPASLPRSATAGEMPREGLLLMKKRWDRSLWRLMLQLGPTTSQWIEYWKVPGHSPVEWRKFENPLDWEKRDLEHMWSVLHGALLPIPRTRFMSQAHSLSDHLHMVTRETEPNFSAGLATI